MIEVVFVDSPVHRRWSEFAQTYYSSAASIIVRRKRVALQNGGDKIRNGFKIRHLLQSSRRNFVTNKFLFPTWCGKKMSTNTTVRDNAHEQNTVSETSSGKRFRLDNNSMDRTPGVLTEGG